jgi:hypothetical protein
MSTKIRRYVPHLLYAIQLRSPHSFVWYKIRLFIRSFRPIIPAWPVGCEYTGTVVFSICSSHFSPELHLKVHMHSKCPTDFLMFAVAEVRRPGRPIFLNHIPEVRRITTSSLGFVKVVSARTHNFIHTRRINSICVRHSLCCWSPTNTSTILQCDQSSNAVPNHFFPPWSECALQTLQNAIRRHISR